MGRNNRQRPKEKERRRGRRPGSGRPRAEHSVEARTERLLGQLWCLASRAIAQQEMPPLGLLQELRAELLALPGVDHALRAHVELIEGFLRFVARPGLRHAQLGGV